MRDDSFVPEVHLILRKTIHYLDRLPFKDHLNITVKLKNIARQYIESTKYKIVRMTEKRSF